MRIQKINLNFSKFIGADLIQKALFIIASILAGKVFTQPFGNIVELQDAAAQYAADYKAAEGLAKTNVKAKSLSRERLERALAAMGMSVMALANGDVQILTDSGFPLMKMPQPRYIQPAGQIKVMNGITSGQIKVIGKRDPAATGYQFLISFVMPGDGTEWTTYNSSRSRYFIDGLKRGQEVWVKFAVIGARNQVSYSSVVSYIVQ